MSDHILIAPMEPLRFLPDAERDVVSRFLFQRIRPVDAASTAEWNRLWRDIFNAEPGECFGLEREEGRDSRFHRRHRAILASLLNSVEGFTNEDALHDWLKMKCWHVDWEHGKAVPASTAFDKCSEARMRKFNKRLVDLLHRPDIQRLFWPHLKAPQRAEMLESVLNPPREPAC